MKKIYIQPQIDIQTINVVCMIGGGSGLNPNGEPNGFGGGAKRHNDFWSDMEETASSWPKGKSVWDD